VSVSVLTAAATALTLRWKGDAALVAAMGGAHVFSRSIPPDFVFPDKKKRKHITIGDQTHVPVPTLNDGQQGSSMTISTHAWTRGYYEDDSVRQLAHLMTKAASATPLVLEGYGTVVLREELAVVMGDPDPDVRHAPVRYRISTWESV
jgi:hypothetical protein